MTNNDYRIYEGEDALVKHLLNRYELEDWTTGTRMAFVDSFVESRDKKGNPFYKFNLRDVNGTILTGRIFNIVDEEAGNKLRVLNRKVAKVEYLVTSYNNELTLNITSIDLAPEDFQGLDKYFLGEVDGLDELPSKILNGLLSGLDSSNPLYQYPEVFKTSMLLNKIKSRALEAYSWKLGSGLLHINNVLTAINGLPLTKEEINRVKVLYLTSEAFVNNERELQDTDLGDGFLNNLKVLETIVNAVAGKDLDNAEFHKTFKKEVLHIVQVRSNMAEPSTLAAHSIELADKLVRTTAMLSEMQKGMTSNSSRYTPAGKIVKL